MFCAAQWNNRVCGLCVACGMCSLERHWAAVGDTPVHTAFLEGRGLTHTPAHACTHMNTDTHRSTLPC